MASVTLYRAANSPDVTIGMSLSPEIETAESYLDNPGFGGETLYTVTVEPRYVVDVRGRNSREEMRKLAAALDLPATEAERWDGNGWDTVHHVIEHIGKAAIAECCDWLIYTDDYPEGATTWRYFGSETLTMEETE